MNKDGGPLPDKYNENEIFVGGELSKREGNILHYHAIGEVGLAGKAIGQFNVKGDIDLNFPLWKDTVSLIARGEVSNQLAPFYMRHSIPNISCGIMIWIRSSVHVSKGN